MPSTSLIVRGAPLPESFEGTLNELWQAMLDRVTVVSPFGDLQIKIGGIEPTSNVGLWIKDGTKVYVWDEDSKKYVPQDLTDNAAYITSLITGLLGGYVTAAALATTLSAYPTTDQVNAAISGAAGGATGVKLIAHQTSSISTGAMLNASRTLPVPFNNIVYDPDAAFSAGRFTVKTAGKYHIVFRIHTDVTSGGADNNAVQGNLFVNSAGVASVIPGTSVFGSFVDEITWIGPLNVGDVVSAAVDFQCTAGPITMEVASNNTSLFITKV